MKYILFGILGIIGLGAVAVLGNLVGTATSVATAPGRVVQQTMGTNNIITNYEWFHQAHAVYSTRVSQAHAHARFLNAETDPAEKIRLRMELSAMQQSCRELATTYNARATMTNRSVFMGREAPTSLDPQACE